MVALCSTDTFNNSHCVRCCGYFRYCFAVQKAKPRLSDNNLMCYVSYHSTMCQCYMTIYVKFFVYAQCIILYESSHFGRLLL